MPDPDDPNSNPSPDKERIDPAQTEGDVPNLGPTSDPAGRDFGDSAGYGSGGSTRDYQEVVGENPVTRRQAQSARCCHPARAARSR
jgi:hypothetical protein